MERLSLVELSRHLIQLVGPFRVVEFEDVTNQVSLTPPEAHAQRIMRRWVEGRVGLLDLDRRQAGQRPIKRLPKPHVLGWEVNDDELLVFVTHRPFDFGHFAATSRPEDAEALYQFYLTQVSPRHGPPLSRQVFDFWCRHRQPASATLLVTGDNQMMLVRRVTDVFLHLNHVHVFGGQVEPGESELFHSAAEEISDESGVRTFELDSWTCLGVCDNAPHQQPIFLCRANTQLTSQTILDGWVRARDPDGPVFCRPFHRRELKRLLAHEQLTPSARALIYLTLNLPEGMST